MLAVRSSKVVLPNQGIGPATILIDTATGKIVDVHAGSASVGGVEEKVQEVIDYGDLVIMPGLVDSHVHVNDPGRTEWETYPNATKAALAGGTTTIGDMPLNCIPVTVSPDAVAAKVAAAKNRIWTDMSMLGGVVPENATTEAIQSLCDSGVSCVKAFMCDSGIEDFGQSTREQLETVLPILRANNVPLMAHAELVDGSSCCGSAPAEAVSKEKSRQFATYLETRTEKMEEDAITMLIELARMYDAHIHIVHLSAASAVPLLKAARAEGLKITVETCPHYLFFAAEDVPEGATWFKCCPPIRSQRNQDLLWEALEDGVIDMIVSDHSPSNPALKCVDTGDFMSAWGGISGVQYRLNSVWTKAKERRISLEKLTEWLCKKPADLVSAFAR
jgi:allantoinase